VFTDKTLSQTADFATELENTSIHGVEPDIQTNG
jgi:hypothetical protein